MKKFGLLLCAALLVLALGGCAAADASGYTEYNGVQISNEDITVMRYLYDYTVTLIPPTDEELLASLAWMQVQYDEAERLGLMPSKSEAEKYYMEGVIKPTMQYLASDDPRAHEGALYTLMLLQEEREQWGMTHDDFCDFLITQWQKNIGVNALYQHVLSQTGLTPGEMSSDVYSDYVENLLAQAAQSKEA